MMGEKFSLELWGGQHFVDYDTKTYTIDRDCGNK